MQTQTQTLDIWWRSHPRWKIPSGKSWHHRDHFLLQGHTHIHVHTHTKTHVQTQSFTAASQRSRVNGEHYKSHRKRGHYRCNQEGEWCSAWAFITYRKWNCWVLIILFPHVLLSLRARLSLYVSSAPLSALGVSCEHFSDHMPPRNPLHDAQNMHILIEIHTPSLT